MEVVDRTEAGYLLRDQFGVRYRFGKDLVPGEDRGASPDSQRDDALSSPACPPGETGSPAIEKELKFQEAIPDDEPIHEQHSDFARMPAM